MSKFYTIITRLGEQLIANAVASQVPLKLTHMAVGDGNGKLPTPSSEQNTLVNEVYRDGINVLTVDEKNKNHLIAEFIIPEVKGGFWIREVGLLDEQGNLVAIGNLPETYKPQMTEGSGKTQAIRMIILLSHTSCVELSIDPNVVIATRSYVDDTIEAHAQSRNHPDATLTEKGFTQLDSSVDSQEETKAATPLAVKKVFDTTVKKAGDTMTGPLTLTSPDQQPTLSFANNKLKSEIKTNENGELGFYLPSKEGELKKRLHFNKEDDTWVFVNSHINALGSVFAKTFLESPVVSLMSDLPRVVFHTDIGVHQLYAEKATGIFRLFLRNSTSVDKCRMEFNPADEILRFQHCERLDVSMPAKFWGGIYDNNQRVYSPVNTPLRYGAGKTKSKVLFNPAFPAGVTPRVVANTTEGTMGNVWIQSVDNTGFVSVYSVAGNPEPAPVSIHYIAIGE